MIKIKQLVLICCTVLTSASTFSQTSLTLVNSYSISDDVSEPSGLTYDKINNQLFAVSDTGNIYRLSITGNLLDTYNFSGDLEGISTYNTPNTLLVAIEDTYQIVEYNYITGNSTFHTMNYDNQGDSGSGIEGVAYNSNSGEIYFLNEKDPGALIVANNNFDVIKEFELSFADDYSASHYVEETDELWLGSDNSSAIYRCRTNGEVIESFEMSINDDELEKIEGIAVDYDNQLLYIVTDEGGELLIYDINTEDETPTNTLTTSTLNEFDANGASQIITVTSNIDWSVSENSDWISVNKTSGSNNDSVTITTNKNSSTNSRSDIINISGSEITRSILVTQAGAENTNSNYITIPSLIEAEDYQTQSGIKTEDTQDIGNGKNVGFIDTDDFLTYNINVPVSGVYTINFRVASKVNDINFDIYSENSIIGSISTNTTSNWQIWKTVSKTMTLIEGEQTIKLIATGSGWNINWLEFSEIENNEEPINPTGSCEEGTNLSLNSSIIDFSSEQNSTNTVQNIINNSTENRWSAQTFPQYVTVDLGNQYDINEINLVTFQNRDYQFIIDGSTTSATNGFFTLVDASENSSEGPITENFPTQTVRYVRLTITGANSYTGEWTSISKFEIICAGTSANKKLFTEDNNLITVNTYPNPFTETITIGLNNYTQEIMSIQLVDLSGNIIVNQIVVDNELSLKNLNNINPGIYLMQLFNTENQIIKVIKVIK